MTPSRHAFGCTMIAAFFAALVAWPAHADTRLDARYTISFAGIPIGKGQWTIDVGAASYTIAASGQASGLVTALISGEGVIHARGVVRAGKAVPTNFSSVLTRGDEKAQLRMELDNGNAQAIVAEEQEKEQDRVSVTDEHRRGIVDPLSAMLVPAVAGSDAASAEGCQRSLPIFDGKRRYDLKLAFKRMEKVKADQGYQGPVAVCAVVFHPVAGHRANSALLKYLTEGREIEMWLAPVAGTGLLVPFRLSIASLIGNMVVQAHLFEAVTAAPRRAATTGTEIR